MDYFCNMKKLLAYVHTRPQILFNAIFGLALFSMFGSLYFSNYGDPVANLANGNMFPFGGGLPPCLLCWWARIFMYPIVFISGVGLTTNDRTVSKYILPLSILGTLLTGYHYALQKFYVVDLFKCSSFVPCSEIQVDYFGFITIPLLGFIAFAAITILAILLRQSSKK